MIWFVVILILMVPLMAVILDSQLGRALAARLERDSVRGDDTLSPRIAALEAEVERLGRDLQRLEDESEFLHRLLESRPGAGDALPSGEQRG